MLLTEPSDVREVLTAALPEPGCWTIGAFLDFYEQNHVLFLKNWRGTTKRLERYIRPLASVPLDALRRLQVIAWYKEIGRTRGHCAANLALQQLHALYAKAADWEVFTARNPADRIKKFPKHSRTRFILSHELPWLLHSLSEELPQVETFFLHLLLTGARLGEAQHAKWTDLDLNQKLWHKQTTKTGVPHTVPLPTALVDRLRQLPRTTEWVYPSQPNSKNGFQAGRWCGTAIEHAWQRIRQRAGLPTLRIHDLRRTCGSWLTIHGENLPLVQKALNHSSLAVTQIYARLDTAPLRRALEDQSLRMLKPVQPLPTPVLESRESQRPEWPG